MTNVLLISEDFVKTNSGLNDNVFGKWLLPAIREAQDMGLQTIIGQCLFEKIIELVKTGEIRTEENIAYKDLLDKYIRDYLLYKTLQNCVPELNVKMANMGTHLTNDEHIVNLTQGESDLFQKSFSIKSDFYRKRLQNFLLNNYTAYPELEECKCNCCYTIKPNLKTTADSSIWLGGLRGR